MPEPTIYCTSFCNFGHRLKDGKPVEHECYIIPPELLRLERAGNTDDPAYHAAWQKWSEGPRRLMRRGVRLPRT